MGQMRFENIGWKGLTELLGIASVVGSLIFVAMEIRQNTDAVRSATIQAITELSYDSTMRMVENADLRAARVAARSGSMTEDQIEQLDTWYTALMRIQQNRLVQSRLGILNLNDAMQIGGRSRAYREPYFAEYWERRKKFYPPEFQEYIEQRVLISADD